MQIDTMTLEDLADAYVDLLNKVAGSPQIPSIEIDEEADTVTLNGTELSRSSLVQKIITLQMTIPPSDTI